MAATVRKYAHSVAIESLIGKGWMARFIYISITVNGNHNEKSAT